MEQKQSKTFEKQWGQMGQQLAQTLSRFSLDLVGLVASYLVGGPATCHVQPKELYRFGGPKHTEFVLCRMASNWRCNQIWIRVSEKTYVLNEEDGHVVFHHDSPLSFFAFNDSGVAFVQRFDNVIRRLQNGQLVPAFRNSYGVSNGMAFYNNQLFLASLEASAILVFEESGTFIRQIKCLDGKGVRFHPYHLLIHSSGEMYITNLLDSNVHVLNTNGIFLRTMMITTTKDKDVALDRQGNMFYIDTEPPYVGVLSSQGEIMTQFGHDFKYRPSGLCIDSLGRILVLVPPGEFYTFAFPV